MKADFAGATIHFRSVMKLFRKEADQEYKQLIEEIAVDGKITVDLHTSV
jgi:hypothetical protein